MGDGAVIPITIRQLEALIRISESFAKMHLLTEVTKEHVERAIKLFRVSTMNALQAGLAENVEFSAERRAELETVEQQVMQRLQPNECISETRLTEHLTRMGYDAIAVRHTIVLMLRKRHLEYMGNKNVLKRINWTSNYSFKSVRSFLWISCDREFYPFLSLS